MLTTPTRTFFVFGPLLFLTASVSAKQAGQTQKPPDYSNQPFVVEKALTRLVVQNDGAYTLDTTARVRIQSQAGVKQFGMLAFPYPSATSTLDIVYVRVTKPDGRVIETPAENVLDMPADITRQAPFYSDLKEKQVAVKGLEAADVLEYEDRNTVKAPLDPGQFWFAFNFFQTGICLEEDWQISLPRGRSFKVISPKLLPTKADEGAYTVYTWKSTHLTTGDKKKPAESDEPARPSVQITSFKDWDEMGQWLQSLLAPRMAPTPAIQAKADELTRNAKTDPEKIQALYDYVSRNFRYIGIALGIGRYQPHAAADVLNNDYGDCKDKHTLFASLLAAEKIKAFPALVSTTSTIDPDLPSPAQFDHIVTAIPQANGFLFLDTTPEVAPFGLLIQTIRGKDALVIPDAGPARLVKTPEDPPFPSFTHFQADGTLDDQGTLESNMHLSLRGDAELLYRFAFRTVGQPQWNDVMQKVAFTLGFGGTVSDTKITGADSTEVPFQIDYHYTRKEYSDWANRRILCPCPLGLLPLAPDTDEESKPVKLGAPQELLFQGSIKLPPDSHPDVPAEVDLHEAFADYHSSYSVSGGSLHFDRRLVIKAREIGPPQIAAYRKFVKAMLDDGDTYVALNGGDTAPAEFAGTPEAKVLYQQGADAWQQRNMAAAAEGFQKAVDKDPKYVQAWLWLGAAHVYSGHVNDGIAEIKKAIALDPSQPDSYGFAASILLTVHRDDDALQVFRQREKLSPADIGVERNIASILIRQKRYSEALADLESAVKQYPDDSWLLLELGDVCFRTGNNEKGVSVIQQAVEKDPNESTWNNAAYFLADYNVDLEQALEYAQKAVDSIEDKTVAIDVHNPVLEDLQTVPALAADWDTLGWVYFRLGRLDQAEKYLSSAWGLSQDPVEADHLQQLYDKLANKRHVARDTLALQSARTIKVGKLGMTKHVSAEFFILLSPGPKVEGVKFIEGADELRGADKALAEAKYDVLFPDNKATHILRRGVLDCEPEVSGCEFVLVPPSMVRSVN